MVRVYQLEIYDLFYFMNVILNVLDPKPKSVSPILGKPFQYGSTRIRIQNIDVDFTESEPLISKQRPPAAHYHAKERRKQCSASEIINCGSGSSN